MTDNNIIQTQEAAARLGVSVDEVEKLVRRGLLHPVVSKDRAVGFSAAEITRITANSGTTVSEEAARIGIQIQRETVSSLSFVRKLVLVAGGGLSSYCILVALFTAMFSFFPLQTAHWLGLIPEASEAVSLSKDTRVLGDQTGVVPKSQPSFLQTALAPVSSVALGIIKYLKPDAYSQIAKEVILDANDVLSVDSSGSVVPLQSLKISDSSALEIVSPGLIANLNSEYLQGRRPGTNVGDIAIVGALQPVSESLSIGQVAISGSTENLTISTGKTLIVSNALTLGGSDGANIVFQGSDTYVGRTTVDTLINKTLVAGSNSISGLTVPNFTSSNISQWNNDSGYITSLSVDTFTNKTISGSDNIITDITNSALSNSGIMFAANSGSGGVALGASLMILGAGINNAVYSGGTVTVTGIESDTLASVTSRGATTAAALTLSNISNAITAGTLTAIGGTINGVAIGATTPSTGVFTTVNGLTITSAADGLTLAGGTTSRQLTLTGADITVGSTIKPTSSGALTIQSNGANILTLDAGGAAAINIGTASSNALAIGRSGVTTTVNGIADTNNLKIGSGTTITKHLSGTATFDAANITLGSCSNIGTVTVTGAAVGDSTSATPTAVSSGIETLLLVWNSFVSSTDTVTIRACNVASGLGQNAADQTWRADVWQH